MTVAFGKLRQEDYHVFKSPAWATYQNPDSNKPPKIKKQIPSARPRMWLSGRMIASMYEQVYPPSPTWGESGGIGLKF